MYKHPYTQLWTCVTLTKTATRNNNQPSRQVNTTSPDRRIHKMPTNQLTKATLDPGSAPKVPPQAKHHESTTSPTSSSEMDQRARRSEQRGEGRECTQSRERITRPLRMPLDTLQAKTNLVLHTRPSKKQKKRERTNVQRWVTGFPHWLIYLSFVGWTRPEGVAPLLPQPGSACAPKKWLTPLVAETHWIRERLSEEADEKQSKGLTLLTRTRGRPGLTTKWWDEHEKGIDNEGLGQWWRDGTKWWSVGYQTKRRLGVVRFRTWRNRDWQWRGPQITTWGPQLTITGLQNNGRGRLRLTRRCCDYWEGAWPNEKGCDEMKRDRIWQKWGL